MKRHGLDAGWEWVVLVFFVATGCGPIGETPRPIESSPDPAPAAQKDLDAPDAPADSAPLSDLGLASAPGDLAPPPDLTPLPVCPTLPAGVLHDFTCNDNMWPLASPGWLTKSITPPSYPYVVTGTTYYLTEGGICHGKVSPHRVLFFLGDSTTPDASPLVLADVHVPTDGVTSVEELNQQYQFGILVHSSLKWTITLPQPITIPYGKTLFISVELGAPGVCVVSCFGEGNDARNWYGSAMDAPWTWNPVVPFQGLSQGLAIAANGHSFDLKGASGCPVDGCTTSTDVTSDSQNCGACGNVCPAGLACQNSVCECPAPKPNMCDAGCVDFANDNHNCGACGNVCGTDHVCSAGVCTLVCGSRQACPTAEPAYCVDMYKDTQNCGGCGIACAPNQICLGGTCECPSASRPGICDGLCVDLDYDLANCGGCGVTCDTTGGRTCVLGSCTCAGLAPAVCDGQCTDLASDANNCGACGSACAAGEVCVDRLCSCSGRTGLSCDLACFDLASDALNCGTCGHRCGAGEVCLDRACRSGVSGTLAKLAGQDGFLGYADGIGAAAQLNGPTGMAADNAGNLFVVDSRSHTIRQIVLATGEVTTLAGLSTMITYQNTAYSDGVGAGASFRRPNDVVFDGEGNLYVTDTLAPTIRKIHIATRTVTTIAGEFGVKGTQDGVGAAASFTTPVYLTYDAGNLYVTDSGAGNIRKIVVATGEVSTLATGFTIPRGITTDGEGTLYVTSGGTGAQLWRVTFPLGYVSPIPGDAGLPTTFSGLLGITCDKAGHLYATDSPNTTTGLGPQVKRVNIADGSVSTFLGGASSSFTPGALPASISNASAVTLTPSGGVVLNQTILSTVVIAYP